MSTELTYPRHQDQLPIDEIDRLLAAPLLRADEVARVLHVGRSTVYQMAARGDLPSIIVGHSVRFSGTDIAVWLKERTRGTR